MAHRRSVVPAVPAECYLHGDMDGLTQTYTNLLSGKYDCVDRIVLNGYCHVAHSPGGFRYWWRALTGSEKTLDNAHLMRMAGRFGRRVRAYAIANNIPIKDCHAGEQKHEIGEEYLSKTHIQEGLFLILVSRSQAPVWNIQEGGYICRKYPYVKCYSFHILDREWGHITIRMSGHPPFPTQIILNGHEYMEWRARHAGILVEKEGNCFTHISDTTRFAQLADTFKEESIIGLLSEVCDRWIYSTCLCFALDADEQRRSRFHYQYSTYQFEYSRNLIFAKSSQMVRILESLADRNRTRMDVNMLKTILGWKQRPYTKKHRKPRNWRIAIERPSYDLTIFKVYCGKIALKIYSKGERLLRAEAMAQNAKELRCGRSVEKFAACVQRLSEILERFLNALSCMDSCFISDGVLDELPAPSLVGATHVGGVDFNRPRIHRVVRALLALSSSPRGFTASQLAVNVGTQCVHTPFAYSPRQAAYDIKKFRGKGIVVRIGNSHRYETSPEGLRMVGALVLLREKVFEPLSAVAYQPEITAGSRYPTPLDQRYTELSQKMLTTLNDLGLAA